MKNTDHIRLALFHLLRAKPVFELCEAVRKDVPDLHNSWDVALQSLNSFAANSKVNGVSPNDLISEGLTLEIYHSATESELPNGEIVRSL